MHNLVDSTFNVYFFFISDGTTLHAGLRFHFRNKYVGLSDEIMESMRRQFEDMMCVIIDEMSLIGADFFYYIHKRMVEVTRNEEIFGNRAMLLVGDLLQIPPTKQTSIYSEPSTLQNKALYKSDSNLWDSCDTVHLTVNKRQGN